MSKLRRKPQTDFLADTPKLDDDAVETGLPDSEVVSEEAARTPLGIDRTAAKDLAKVTTNDQTPRCPFCLSPKLQPLTMENPWGRKWVCNNCCTAFREPVQGKSA